TSVDRNLLDARRRLLLRWSRAVVEPAAVTGPGSPGATRNHFAQPASIGIDQPFIFDSRPGPNDEKGAPVGDQTGMPIPIAGSRSKVIWRAPEPSTLATHAFA